MKDERTYKLKAGHGRESQQGDIFVNGQEDIHPEGGARPQEGRQGISVKG